MSRYIDADACIADIEERLCKPCKDKGEDYHGVRCRACWVDDAIGEIDGYADNSIDIVRCKECKHWDDHRNDSWWSQEGACLKTSRLGDATYRNADDFCSYGEVREREIIVKEWHDEKGLIHRREVGQELVRCKECVHNGVIDTDCPFGWRDDYLPTSDDFCSYGERSDNE